jgi:RecA-family ATPase
VSERFTEENLRAVTAGPENIEFSRSLVVALVDEIRRQRRLLLLAGKGMAGESLAALAALAARHGVARAQALGEVLEEVAAITAEEQEPKP